MANVPTQALACHMHRHVPLLRALSLHLLLGGEQGLLLVCGVPDGPVDAAEHRGHNSFGVHFREGALSCELSSGLSKIGIASRDVLRFLDIYDLIRSTWTHLCDV